MNMFACPWHHVMRERQAQNTIAASAGIIGKPGKTNKPGRSLFDDLADVVIRALELRNERLAGREVDLVEIMHDLI